MEEMGGIYARHSGYLDRYVQLGIAGDKVVHASFPETPESNAEEEHDLLDRIEGYLGGTDEPDFTDVDVGLTVPTEQRRVLETVRGIPYGREVTVERVTRMTTDLDPDEEEDRAVVREALAANPIPLLIPDHRVSDGPSAAPPSVEQRLRSLEGLGS